MMLRGSREVVVKLLIYEAGLCRPWGGDWPDLPDGVYFLVRTDGVSSGAIWNRKRLELESAGMSHDITVGLVPNYEKRFAYRRLALGDDLDEIATLLADCANTDGILRGLDVLHPPSKLPALTFQPRFS